MTIHDLRLVRSLNLQSTKDKVRDHTVLDFAEYGVLRDSAAARLDQLVRAFHEHGEFEALHQATQRMAQSLQASCLLVRRLEMSAEQRRLAYEALDQQMVYLQACLRRSLSAVKSSA
ncbi:hypothetical protein G7007_14975 [Pseudomonas entomophila]|jgi:hypothetical protein|uniref:hypothetical protein n=1 Tax=Pseudomonas entomophila TaxID=312306 RepID=UPI0015E28256|nr:hypothetical protein [Pseudomonas entomophila]MBA1194139.1 hypothetical protein [Pseudomonas entomophila]